MYRRILALLALVGVMLCLSRSCHAEPITAPPAKQTEAMARWRALKYGMFIHFGMSTFTGREIDPGDQPSTTYAPSDLDVDQWICTARDAGMKYAVLTAKHVPGHCLWDSKVQWRGKEYDYDVATSRDQTDVIEAFVKACHKYDLTPGLYWCLLDFRNNSVPHGPQWKAGKLPEDFFQLAKDQLAELLSRYPDIGYLWLDIPRAASAAQRVALYTHIKQAKPDCIVLFNHGTVSPDGPLTIGGFQVAWPTDVLNTERHPAKPGGFTATQTWQGKTHSIGYEHCDTICQRWFWTSADRAKSIRQLYRLHQQVTSAGGNLLLNVPPDKTGRIPDDFVQTLLELKKVLDDPVVFPDPITLGKPVKTSNVYEKDPQYAGEFAVDDRLSTRWATDQGVQSAWLQVDLGELMTFDRAVIAEAYPELNRIRAFRIEYRLDGSWIPFHMGQRIGAERDVTFQPITAQHVRLNITESTDGPTIQEFQLFAPK